MSRRLIRALAKDRRGVAAVEFALIAPIMVLLYMSVTELCAGFMAQKRVGHMTSLVADLVSQEEAVSQQNLGGLTQISGAIMSPFGTGYLSQRVRSVTLVDNEPVVDWTYKSLGQTSDGEDAFGDDASVTLPAGLIADGESLIVSDSVYDFQSPVRYLIPGGLRLKAIYYLRPRAVPQIPCSDC